VKVVLPRPRDISLRPSVGPSVCLSRAIINTSRRVRLAAIPACVRTGHVTNYRLFAAGNEPNKAASVRRSTDWRKAAVHGPCTGRARPGTAGSGRARDDRGSSRSSREDGSPSEQSHRRRPVFFSSTKTKRNRKFAGKSIRQ